MMTKTRIACAAIAATSLYCGMAVAASTTIGQPAAATATALERCLSAKAQAESFSGTIWVTHHDLPVAFIAKGVLAGPGSEAITAATRFNLASMGKMFTAVAIGQLVDAGKIHWDDSVGKFIPGLTPEASAVTVRQLLTHSSGLGDFFRPENMEAMLKATTASDILPLIASEKPSFPPGSQFRYSNSGFALLGVLIERVSGERYADYLRDHVFLPAGMNDTSLSPEPLASLAVGMTALRAGPPSVSTATPSALAGQPADRPAGQLLAPGMSAEPSGQRVLVGPDGKPLPASAAIDATSELQPAPGATQGMGSPAGGLFSTAADIQRFVDALLAEKLVSAATAQVLTSPQIVAFPAKDGRPELDYGMGFGVGSEFGQRWFGHNGGTVGANVEFAEFPEEQWTLSVFSNRDPPVASTLFRYLKELLFKPGALQTCANASSS